MSRKKQKVASGKTKTGTRKKPDNRALAASDKLTALLESHKADPHDIAVTLELGETYVGLNQQDQLTEIVQSLEKQSPFSDSQTTIRYHRLAAFDFAWQSKFIEAEALLDVGEQMAPDQIDFAYVRAYVKLSLKERHETVNACDRYLKTYDALAIESPALPPIAVTSSHLSQLRNFRGTANRDLGNIDEAVRDYEASIGADAGNHMPYLNLVHILLKSDRKAAGETVRRGLASCRQVHELRILDEGMKRTATISACMIVKDEEELLPGCLDSIRDWVDEIIVVDTGSSDGTVEIAESYGARVFHQQWAGDFAKHRNYSMEQASSDWIFIIDADERMHQEDVPLLLNHVNAGRFGIISINVFNLYESQGQATTFLPSVRLVRRDLNLKYEGIVHNRLVFKEDEPILRLAVRIEHLGYDLDAERMKKKFERTKELLEQQLGNNPDDYFALFNYSQLLRGEGQDCWKKNGPIIIEKSRRAVELTSFDILEQRNTHLMCLDQVAWASFYCGLYDQALEYAQRAIELKPDYLDPLILLGHVYSQTGDYTKGIAAYEKYIDVQAAYDPTAEIISLILTNPHSEAIAWYGLATIAELQDNPMRAIECYLQTLKANPTHLEACGNLGRLYLTRGETATAERYLRQQQEKAQPTVDAALGLAYISEERTEIKQAESHFRQALQIDPKSRTAHSKYGRFMLKQGRESDGFAMLQEARELSAGDAAAFRELGDIFFEYDRPTDAAESYQAAFDNGDHSPELLNNLANAHFKAGAFSQAESFYRQALESDQPLSISLRNLGLALHRQRKLEEAAVVLQKYLELEPDQIQFAQILGDICCELSWFEKAISYFEKYLAAAGAQAPAIFKLSECYLQLGHRDSAIVGYRRVIGLDPDHQPALERLAEYSVPVNQP